MMTGSGGGGRFGRARVDDRLRRGGGGRGREDDDAGIKPWCAA